MDASRPVSIEGEGSGGESRLRQWVRAHELAAFFVLTFVLTFGGWVAAMLSGAGALFDLGLWGPAFSAVAVTALSRGGAGLKDLLRRLLPWRVPPGWYLAILLGYPALLMLAALLHAQLTGQTLRLQWDNWENTMAFLRSAPVLGFWACEEIGWRGFALPRLQGRWSALTSSVILGLVWAAWHLPYFAALTPDFLIFPVYTIAISILMTWVYNHTGGSLFVATLFHFWVNVYSGFQADKFPLANPNGEALAQYLVLAGAAVVVVAVYGYRRLTREREPALRVAG